MYAYILKMQNRALTHCVMVSEQQGQSAYKMSVV